MKSTGKFVAVAGDFRVGVGNQRQGGNCFSDSALALTYNCGPCFCRSLVSRSSSLMILCGMESKRQLDSREQATALADS
jgi:hypothetical protein